MIPSLWLVLEIDFFLLFLRTRLREVDSCFGCRVYDMYMHSRHLLHATKYLQNSCSFFNEIVHMHIWKNVNVNCEQWEIAKI